MRWDATFKRLSAFSALAETGSFRRAAYRLGVTQPALSYHISKLEDELATRLFERTSSGVLLTPEGRAALGLVHQILDAYAALESIGRGGSVGAVDEVRLGASPTLGPYILPRVMQRLQAKFSTLRIFIEDAAPSILLDGLLSGRHDVILAQLPLHSDRIVVERLFREPLKLAMPATHALAAQVDVSDEDLAGEEVLSLSSAFTLHYQLSALCDEVGARLRTEYEGTSLDALRQMVAMQMGVTFLPAMYVSSEVSNPRNGVAVRRFRKDRFTRSIGLARRITSGENVVVKELSAIIREVVREEFSGIVMLEGS